MVSNSLNTKSYLLILSLIILAGLALATPVVAQDTAIQPAADAQAVAEAALAEEAAEESSNDAGAADLDPGMQIPVDGSSLEAFNESLATIKAQAQEPNYVSLEGAIQYLLVYDISAGRDKAKLAKNLDGLTGDEIIGKVNWRQTSK